MKESDDEMPEARTSQFEEEEEDDIVESDIELEGETVEPDNDPPKKTGDASVDVMEENRESSQELKAKAMKVIFEGKLEEAIENLTEAITLNPTSAIMYATREPVIERPSLLTLVERAIELRSELENASSDVSSLYAKIERKYKIEDGNRALIQKFQSKLTQQLQILHKTLTTSMTQIEQQLMHMEEDMKSFVSTKAEADRLKVTMPNQRIT